MNVSYSNVVQLNLNINKALLAPMNVFEPLAADSFPRHITEECPLKVSELSVLKRCYL